MSAPVISFTHPRLMRKKGETVETVEEMQDTHEIGQEEARVTPGANKAIAEYEASTDNDLVQFVKNLQEGRCEDPNAESYFVGQASLRAGQDVYDLTGIDIAGYMHNIKGNAVEHIENRHGANGVHDHSMANIDDYGRIGYVLEHYDEVDIIRNNDGSGKNSMQFLDSAGNPSPMVRYEKRINGTFYVVEAIPDTKSRTLHIVSAYKSKAEKGGRQKLDAAQTPKPHVRNDSAVSAKSNAKRRGRQVSDGATAPRT